MFVLLVVFSRLGWLHSAGFTSLGQRQIWLILLIPLAYSIVTSLYAFTGNFELGFSDPTLAGSAILFLMFHAFLEEVTFRGLIMPAYLRTWGSANRGVIKSVLVSSIFFAGYHILYLAGEPFLIVLFRMIVSFLLGILLGALVLRGRSIYPAVFFHGILNVAGSFSVAVAQRPDHSCRTFRHVPAQEPAPTVYAGKHSTQQGFSFLTDRR